MVITRTVYESTCSRVRLGPIQSHTRFPATINNIQTSPDKVSQPVWYNYVAPVP